MKYFLTVKLNDAPIDFMKEIDDPFVRVEMNIHWWDRLKNLFKKEFRVTFHVDGDKEAIFKVMNLEASDD